MKQEINELIEISKFFGGNKDFVIAGGGNTSFKDDDTIWIKKASGYALADMTGDNIVGLSREKLHIISSAEYSDDPVIREEQVKDQLYQSLIDTRKRDEAIGGNFTARNNSV